MRRKPFKEGNLSPNSVGIGTVPRDTVLRQAKELATSGSDWLRKVAAADFAKERCEDGKVKHQATVVNGIDEVPSQDSPRLRPGQSRMAARIEPQDLARFEGEGGLEAPEEDNTEPGESGAQ